VLDSRTISVVAAELLVDLDREDLSSDDDVRIVAPADG